MSVLQSAPDILARLQADQTSLRIRVRIPKDRQEQPVLSRLISQHGITITIRAALLSPNASDDGWFDLELQAPSHQIRSAVLDLYELGADLWLWPDQDA